MDNNDSNLLEISNLAISFRMYRGLFKQEDLKVITDLSVSVRPGEILAIVGASGSGKSLLAESLLGLLPANASATGSFLFKGHPVDQHDLKKLRGKEIALLPQSIMAFDPLMKVGKLARGARPTKNQIKTQEEVFSRLGLPPGTDQLYPFQLSGGMARRVLFSTVISSGADLIIADEPTPGMQVNQAMEALQMLKDLANQGKGVLLITHDIDLAVQFADQIGVFYAGTVLETCPTEDFKVGPDALRHPYSKALWHALPQHDFQPIPGSQPYPEDPPPGCPFAPRCSQHTPECDLAMPPMRELRSGQVRCIHAT